MQTNVNPVATVVPKTHAPAAATAAVITLAAAAGVRHVVDMIFASYSEDPATGSLTIASTVNGTAVSQAIHFIESDRQVVLNFNPPLQGDENTAITITLASGGGTCVGLLNAMTR